MNSYDRIRTVIENDSLRAYVNNYIGLAVRRYEEEQRKNKRPIKEKSIEKIEKQAFLWTGADILLRKNTGAESGKAAQGTTYEQSESIEKAKQSIMAIVLLSSRSCSA